MSVEKIDKRNLTYEQYKEMFNIPFDVNVGKNPFDPVPTAPVVEDVDEEFKIANCYKNNHLLKGSMVNYPYTPESEDELLKCRDDIYYFLENYCQIVNLDDGLIKFKPHQYQKNMVKIMDENRFSIFKVGRQAGKCVDADTIITVRNKKSGLVEDITIIEFYNRQKNHIQ